MLDEMLGFIASNTMCVLATTGTPACCSSGRLPIPHCSLMAYVSIEGGVTLYMVTSKDSRKFLNMQEVAQVSLLIDDRHLHASALHSGTKALTVSAIAELQLASDEYERARALFHSVHPHLDSLIHQPESALIRLTVRELLLLTDSETSFFEKIA
ncbi:pyridoxamine 5'-phosphate oxidase family protein [Oleidesulfovibrio sp.]|uniref:pyridoxamine 5'-phosphate oxidase family protein n=1 Tax=Oleidesulfovibrio sp. TaxID=2909707 RepID=UPI003A8B7949